jgi:beta-galactosidase
MIEYWHWHTCHFGNETYWGGILGHSLEPGRCYDELARIGAELARIGADIADLEPDEDVAFLVSPESRWALEFQPALAVEGTNTPDRNSYDRILSALYRGFFDAGVHGALVHPQQLGDNAAALMARWPVFVVPALLVAGAELLETLARYAYEGGHLVLTFRSGYADEDARPRPTVMPGVLSKAVGARYWEFTNLANPIPVHVVQQGTNLAVANGHAIGWADGLVPETATPLARYEHPHLARWAAITTNAYGAGRVTYIGTLPDPPLAEALARWVATTSLPEDPWRERPASVTSTGARAANGRRIRFLSNWNWDPVAVELPHAVDDLLSGQTLPAGESVTLGPWDVRVLVELTRDVVAAPTS